jgi:acyl carrier protein
VSIDREELKQALKQLIIIECDKEDEFTVADISDDEALIGSQTNLALDSLDTLQLSLAIKKAYNVRIEGAKEGRIAFASINAMADYILENPA